MSSSKAPKQEISKQERIQSQRAAEKWNERIDDGYLELEMEAVADSELDHSGRIAGQASGDVALAEADALSSEMSAGGPTARGLSDLGNTINAAVTTADVDAKSEAQKLKDTKMLGVSKLGSDVSLNTSNALKTSAGLGASRAVNKLQNETLVNNSKASALMTAAEGLGTGMMMRSNGYRLGKGGLTRIDTGGNEGLRKQPQGIGAGGQQ